MALCLAIKKTTPTTLYADHDSAVAAEVGAFEYMPHITGGTDHSVYDAIFAPLGQQPTPDQIVRVTVYNVDIPAMGLRGYIARRGEPLRNNTTL